MPMREVPTRCVNEDGREDARPFSVLDLERRRVVAGLIRRMSGKRRKAR